VYGTYSLPYTWYSVFHSRLPYAPCWSSQCTERTHCPLPGIVCTILVFHMLHAGVVSVRNVLIALAVLCERAPVFGLWGDEGAVKNVR
jgi:hypothetical protein